jgi:outer membrane protein assembly factor BamB
LLTDKLNCGTCGKACSTFCNNGLCDASIKCSVALGDDVFSTPAVDSAGNVYVVSSTGKVTSYKPDCTLRWSFSAGYYTTSSPVLSPDEKIVYVSTTGGPATLYALDAATGGKTWSKVIGVGWSDFNTPAVASDGTIYAIGCTASGGTYNQTVQALSPAGVSKWSVNISSTGSSTNTGGPAIAADGTIYALASNGQVSAITPTGQQKWSVSLGCCSTNVSPALGSDGHLYVIASTGKTLYKLNSASGATLWSRSLGSLSVTHVSPVTDGQGNVYLALPDGTVRAWAADGTGLWSLPASGKYNASLALGSDGVLYAVNGSNGSLRALRAASGSTLWSLQVDNAVSSSPNLSTDGILWVGAGKKLWAVTTGAVTGLASKGYPKRHADRANSGRD